MEKISIKLTVFFEDPFWVGVFEILCDNTIKVSKATFGAEPKDNELYDFILNKYHRLSFSEGIQYVSKNISVNPKRLQKNVKKEVLEKGVGTKSQQALKLQQEQNKLERKTKSKEEKALELQQKFNLKQQKRLQKHKGH